VDLPYDSMLERFRLVRDQIELRMRGWLEHPEGELKRLREHEHRERLEEAADREREREAAHIGETGPEGWDPFRRA
jgi:arsenate reductase (thioredoxin)